MQRIHSLDRSLTLPIERSFRFRFSPRYFREQTHCTGEGPETVSFTQIKLAVFAGIWLLMFKLFRSEQISSMCTGLHVIIHNDSNNNMKAPVP